MKGDIINWETEKWDLRSPWNRSVSETLDLEKDVCNMREQGLFMVPQQLSYKESVHSCNKMAGTVASFTQRQEFEDIVHFLSLRQNMRASACVEEMEDGSSLLQVWAGASDQEVEGVWRTHNNSVVNVRHLSSIERIYKCCCSIYHGQKTDLTMMATFIIVLLPKP